MDDCQRCRVLEEENATLRDEIKDLTDKLIRALAEQENIRTRYKLDTGKEYASQQRKN